MLTDAQFYLRVLELAISDRYGGLPNIDDLFEEEDLCDYLENRLGVKAEAQDGGIAYDQAEELIESTIHGFIKTLGQRAGIDLKLLR